MYYLLISFFFLLTQGNATISTYSYQLGASPSPTPQIKSAYEQAVAYENGVGVIQDPSKAFDLFLQCAKQDDSRAKYKAGVAYFNGAGVAKDQVEGLAWMYKAVDSGVSKAVCASMEEAMGAEMSMKARQRASELVSGCSSSTSSVIKGGSSLYQVIKSNISGDSGADTQADFEILAKRMRDEAIQRKQVVASKSNNSKIYETEFLDWMKAHPSLRDSTASELFDLHEGWLAMRRHPTGPNQSPIVARGTIQQRPPVNPSTKPSDPRILNSIGEQREVSKNIDAAAEYYKMAADQSYPSAQYNLARLYLNGQGVPQSREKAFEYFQKAAAAGNLKAATKLGFLYSKEKNYPLALKWISYSAERGEPYAQCQLGVFYTHGHGIPKNLVSAYKWFNLAGSKGIKDSQKNREIVAQEMTPFQIQEGQRLSSEWSPQPQATP